MHQSRFKGSCHTTFEWTSWRSSQAATERIVHVGNSECLRLQQVQLRLGFTRELRHADPTTSLTRCDHAVMPKNKCIAAWLDNDAQDRHDMLVTTVKLV